MLFKTCLFSRMPYVSHQVYFIKASSSNWTNLVTYSTRLLIFFFVIWLILVKFTRYNSILFLSSITSSFSPLKHTQSSITLLQQFYLLTPNFTPNLQILTLTLFLSPLFFDHFSAENRCGFANRKVPKMRRT